KIMDSFVSIRSHGALISPNKGQQDNCSERTMHEWPQLRRQELCSAPQFIVNGATRLDVCQGALNDCWLLSAIASLSVNRFLLNKVMPLEQSFKDGYKGCFTFSFWQYGQWEEVKIDDFLPTKDNKLIYLSSPERDEFWSALLEKAYAKLKGGYRALDMGFPHEAMVDMTGGVTEVFNISLLPQDLPAFLRHLLARGALINCANCQGPLEQSNGLGIMFRHAYSLTAVEQVKTAHGIVDLVRILNPWGNTEWSGPWSDLKGPEWEAVNKEEQKRLERVKREDGEFWMSVSDFRRHFETMEVCHLTDSLSETGSSVLPWCCVMHHGNWVPKPSVLLHLVRVDRGTHNSHKTCSFVLALMQKHQRRRGVNLAIALHIYPAHPKNTYLSPKDLQAFRPVLFLNYSMRREVVLRGSLPPGRYIIVPSTAEPNQPGAFLLRVLTEQGNAATLLLNLLCSVLAGSEKYLALEHCKSLVVLTDVSLKSYLMRTSVNACFYNHECFEVDSDPSCVHISAPGIMVDDLIMQLVGLRYTEPDLTISYPGFLYLLMKLESMAHKFQAHDITGMGSITVSYRQVRAFIYDSFLCICFRYFDQRGKRSSNKKV
uniref:Calpain catalytic domain-containing protein n=1 Tax=Gasterosteus aculeatus aculeatus TaxID=481459 RepID=G3PIF7_GASAC